LRDFLFAPSRPARPVSACPAASADGCCWRKRWRASNLLVLDERQRPHLETLDLLEEYDRRYPGTVMLSRMTAFSRPHRDAVVVAEGDAAGTSMRAGYSDMVAQRAKRDGEAVAKGERGQPREKSERQLRAQKSPDLPGQARARNAPARIASWKRISPTSKPSRTLASTPRTALRSTRPPPPSENAQAELAQAEDDWLRLRKSCASR